LKKYVFVPEVTDGLRPYRAAGPGSWDLTAP
jgi:hypothetical protein